MVMICLIASVLYFYGIFSLMPLPDIDWRITGGILVLLNQGDQWTTRRFIKKGHREGNPLWAFVFKKIGVGILRYVIVTGVIVLIVLLLWEKIGIAGQLALVINAIFTIIYNIIVTKK